MFCIFYFSILSTVIGCTSRGEVYRNLISNENSELCNNAQLQEEFFESAQSDDIKNCSTQTFLLPSIEKTGISNNSSFKLSFLEFGKNHPWESDRLLSDPQLTTLTNELKKPGQKVIITYVHGWRHNASVGDTNVKDFKLLLGYTRNFLNYRCRIAKRYCNARLHGIYIGWRGATLAEPKPNTLQSRKDQISSSDKALTKGIYTVLAGTTVWSRKKKSEELSKLVFKTIKGIEETIQKESNFAKPNKMLIVGHSFGGNMLATALEDKAIEAISTSNHRLGKVVPPILGDLTVLLNPAAEASKWTNIQHKILARADPDSELNDEPTPQKALRKKSSWNNLFSKKQKPVYISLTANCNWSQKEAIAAKASCDNATGDLFPLAHFWRFNNKEKQLTIGHLDPVYDGAPDHEKNYAHSRLVGTSHELILNHAAMRPTSYNGLRDKSECAIADGWLSKTIAREEAEFEDKGHWDSGCTGPCRPNLTPVVDRKNKKEGRIENQFRQGLSLPKNAVKPKSIDKDDDTTPGTLRSTMPPYVPFWNVRTHLGIEGHNGFVNYPTWCGINQMLLDDIVGN